MGFQSKALRIETDRKDSLGSLWTNLNMRKVSDELRVGKDNLFTVKNDIRSSAIKPVSNVNSHKSLQSLI